MLKNNFKKAFTLAELMVVLAIIWILTAAAMNIFTWAIATARDSTRVTDLKTMQTALESYYIKHKVYPQPAKQTKENVWGYENQDAIATCPVTLRADWTIDSLPASNKCWWKIVVKEKKVSEITCWYKYRDSSNAEIESADNTISNTLEYQKINTDWDDVENNWTVILENIYEFDSKKDVCMDFLQNQLKMCESLDDNTDTYSCSSLSSITWIGDIDTIYKYYKWWGEPIVSIVSATYSTANLKQNIIWWKWTLTKNSWIDSIWKESPKKSFDWFMQDNANDPKYKSSKYKDFWFWYYPYSVFRDWVWENNLQSNWKTIIWWTAYQIAATLEKQDKDWNYHPETLIVWNYKRPKNSNWKIKAWYPRSLFWNWYNVIVNWQKEWEKAKYVSRPNWTTNRWIPYWVEEIQ